MIALFARDLDAHQADIADVVLGAGVVATGDVEVDGLVDLEVLVERVRESNCVGLRIAGCKAATLVAGACHGPAENPTCLELQSSIQ